MPKKRPLTPVSLEHIMTLARQARTAFLEFRSVASGHLRQTERVRRRAERLLEDFDDLLEELKNLKDKR